MTVPCSGTIKASDINKELGRAGTGPFKIGSPEERSLAGKPSGLIKFSDFACKSRGFAWYIAPASNSGNGVIGFDTGGPPGTFGSIDGYSGHTGTRLYPAGYMNSTAGVPFYFRNISGMSGGGYGMTWNFDLYAPTGKYVLNTVAPWGRRTKVTLTDANGVSISGITGSNVRWVSGKDIYDYINARVYQTVIVVFEAA